MTKTLIMMKASLQHWCQAPALRRGSGNIKFTPMTKKFAVLFKAFREARLVEGSGLAVTKLTPTGLEPKGALDVERGFAEPAQPLEQTDA